MRMLNQLSNANTAKHLPSSLLPVMRQILYSGYRNIMIAALVLIAIALALVVTLALKRSRQARAEA